MASNIENAIDFGMICRLCLNKNEEFIRLEMSRNIADSDSTEMEQFTSKLTSLLGIQMKEEDVFPKWICTACFMKVQDISQFIDMCLESQEVLRSSLSNEMISLESQDDSTRTIKDELEVSLNCEEIVEFESKDTVAESVTICENNWDLLNEKTDDETACEDCSRIFESKYELTIHRISIHHDDLVDISGLTSAMFCNECLVEMPSQQAYKVHKKSHAYKSQQISISRKLEVISCRYCGGGYLNNDWAGHCESIHNVPKSKQVTRKSFECRACLRPFLRLSALFNHVQRHHPESLNDIAEKEGVSVNWLCTECNFENSNETELSQHSMEVHGKPTAKLKTVQLLDTCECGYIMTNQLEDRLHEIFMHQIADGGCPGCDFKFESIQELQVHVFTYHYFLTGGVDCHCLICDEPCTSLPKLKLHLIKEHKIVELQENTVSNTKAWKCAKKDCEVTLSAMELLAHGRTEHGLEALYYCEACDCCFETEQDLNGHSCCDTGSQPDETQEAASYVCPTCSKTFLSKMNLHNHFKRRHLVVAGKFICSFCGKSLKGRVALRSHEDRLHRGVRRFKCEECPLAFTTAGILRKHTEIHMIERPMHTCEICGRKFTTVSGHSRHVATHNGIKHFICPMNPCRKAFYTKNELRRHVKFHTHDFQHECHVCGHKFVAPGELRKHLTKHTGQRPFQCHICSAKYARKDDKVKHMKRVHNLRIKRIYGSSAGEVYVQEEPTSMIGSLSF